MLRKTSKERKQIKNLKNEKGGKKGREKEKKTLLSMKQKHIHNFTLQNLKNI